MIRSLIEIGYDMFGPRDPFPGEMALLGCAWALIAFIAAWAAL